MIAARAGVGQVLVLAAALAACGSPSVGTAPEARATAAQVASASSTAVAPSGAPTAAPLPAATAAQTAVASAAPTASPAAEDPKNKVEPEDPAGDALQSRARAVFDAIVADDPTLAEPFWFPKEPFLPLKDIKGPERYWEVLHSTYAMDVHALHKTRRSWEGAKFLRFEIGSTPKWVKPGEEANKIGYYRSFRGKLHFEADGKASHLDVHTVITWQGRWYVTHLRRMKR